jgi:pyruvate formate lyase activating enzyme
MGPTGIIFDIKRFSVNDGPGIRTTIFFKGCPLTCWWCHNPESRSCDPEPISMIRNLDGKEFNLQEVVGKRVTVEEVLLEIEKETIFHETSGGGVTFSGGEPLFQPEFLTSLAAACRLKNIHTCLDTSGYCDPGLFRSFIPGIDLFLFDIKILDRDKHIHYMGCPNDDILVNLAQLDHAGGHYIIRVPVIPGINDDRKSMDDLGNLLQQLRNPGKEIHFLPFHDLARRKIKNLGLKNKMDPAVQVNESELHKLVDDFERSGFRVIIGG